MQRGGGRNDLFGSVRFSRGSQSFGGSGSLTPSLFGGRDPFDDPFFTEPFGSMIGPGMFGNSMFGSERSMMGPGIFGNNMFGSQWSLMGPGILGNSMFGSERSRLSRHPSSASLLQRHAPFIIPSEPIIEELPSDEEGVGISELHAPSTISKGPIIEEISSDEEGEGEDIITNEKNKNLRKRPRLDNDDDETEGSKFMKYDNNSSMTDMGHVAPPLERAYSFHNSTVTYSGADGACYTSSATRRTEANGVTVEESKEADTRSGRATHRVSRGIHEKGHSVTRKLSGGRVETMQTLHNLNQDELPGFEEAWTGVRRQYLPGWNHDLIMHDIEINGDGMKQAGAPGTRLALPPM